ncbi:hypothetical protein [Selenomonas ruminantium]|uniref:hypothetical protein n=1 Tax=Selenomonas ruminantium TaxID=971 RepID=UPI00047ABF03|nr:hypothetical protein [Selenomonas ruminantium]
MEPITNVEKLIYQLKSEQTAKYKNGIYHYTQTSLAYNSNRIEGSRLSHEHTINLFIIDNDHKQFYYRGLREFYRDPGYLTDTCLSAQDKYTAYCRHLVKGYL